MMLSMWRDGWVHKLISKGHFPSPISNFESPLTFKVCLEKNMNDQGKDFAVKSMFTHVAKTLPKILEIYLSIL